MEQLLKPFDERMEKTIEVFENELATIRAGRANPRVLDRITVNYYGVPTPLNQIGNVSVPEPRMITVQPWDASVLKDIERAIHTSDLGINPVNDGKLIRITFPELTEERRANLTKEVKKKGDDSKIAIRNIRRDANETFKKLEKDSEITEDELRTIEEDTQKLTDDYIVKIDKIVEEKNKDIMTV